MEKKPRVVVGLSGGVDSAVSVIKLQEAGYEVEGMFMRNWDSSLNNDILGNPHTMDDVCPQEVDYMDALDTANSLGIKLHRIDFVEEYWSKVFEYFLSEYKKFRTPNPDILCNKEIKFRCFLDKAMEMGFDYIICDSPAGIETGALMSLYFADIAIVTTNPEVSSVRDSDRIIGILDSKSRRAEYGLEPIKPYLLLTRYDPNRVDGGHMLSMDEVIELLSIELIGVIPESKSVLEASNLGKPTVYIKGSDAGMAYMDTVKRILGQHVDFRFTQKVGIFKRLLGKK